MTCGRCEPRDGATFGVEETPELAELHPWVMLDGIDVTKRCVRGKSGVGGWVEVYDPDPDRQLCRESVERERRARLLLRPETVTPSQEDNSELVLVADPLTRISKELRQHASTKYLDGYVQVFVEDQEWHA